MACSCASVVAGRCHAAVLKQASGSWPCMAAQLSAITEARMRQARLTPRTRPVKAGGCTSEWQGASGLRACRPQAASHHARQGSRAAQHRPALPTSAIAAAARWLDGSHGAHNGAARPRGVLHGSHDHGGGACIQARCGLAAKWCASSRVGAKVSKCHVQVRQTEQMAARSRLLGCSNFSAPMPLCGEQMRRSAHGSRPGEGTTQHSMAQHSMARHSTARTP